MYRALKTFSGKISMVTGDLREIKDKEVIGDLLKAGYIEEVKPTKKKKEEE